MNSNHKEIIQVGEVINGQYLILEKYSDKAGRKTYLAQDNNDQQLVIIKIILFGIDLVAWDEFKLFERESVILKRLDHQFIPQYLDYFEIKDSSVKGFALVQTYIDAPSLEALVKQGRKFSEAELIEITEKILAILIYLHLQNPSIIHRDLKPSNILITNRSGNSIGDLYLVDFGSVQTVARKDNGTITIVGSYGYIPLEQFGGQTTPASDLYSLGMTLIYLITGVHPADLPLVNGRVQLNSNDLSGKFLRWLDKMTQPLLDKRFSSAKAALTALKSEDGSSGDFIDLRPAGSQIDLQRDLNKLEIVYSAPHKKRGAWFFVLLYIIATVASSGVLLFFGVLIFMGLYEFCNFLFLAKKHQYHLISIERSNKIKCGNFTGNTPTTLEWEESSISTRDVNLIAYNPGYIFNEYLDEKGEAIKRGQVTVAPTLSIYAGQVECLIGKSSLKQLSQAELWWLGKEISDFLGMELQVFYPTPQAPPEPDNTCGC